MIGKLIRFVFVGLMSLQTSDAQISEAPFQIDSISPKGTYSLKLIGLSPRNVDLQVRKRGQVVLQERPFFFEDTFEASFLRAYPTQRWVNDFVFRLGKDLLPATSYDEIVLLNNSGEWLKYLIVNYGKYETFIVFDVAPNAKVILKASPHLGKPSQAYVGYWGKTQSEESFQNIEKHSQRRSSRKIRLTFTVSVSPRAK